MATVASTPVDDQAAPAPEELIEKARAMIPAFKARAKECVASRDVPAESIAEIKEAGFFRILQPRRFGGYEMHPNVFFEVQKLLAEGCMSTGWMFGVVGCHPFELALFPKQAQDEVWGDAPDTLVSSSYQPVGKVTHAEGGFSSVRALGILDQVRPIATGFCLARWFRPRQKAKSRTCAPSCFRAATTPSTKTPGTCSDCREPEAMTSSLTRVRARTPHAPVD